jgi:hypothetical protein
MQTNDSFYLEVTLKHSLAKYKRCFFNMHYDVVNSVLNSQNQTNDLLRWHEFELMYMH